MMTPIESKFYMEANRLMLAWTAFKMPEGVAGATVAPNCSGTVDVTGLIESAIERALSKREKL